MVLLAVVLVEMEPFVDGVDETGLSFASVTLLEHDIPIDDITLQPITE